MRWRVPDPLEATRAEYAAFDQLPPSLRRFLREYPTDLSARKVFARWNAHAGSVKAVLQEVREWEKKQSKR